MFRKNRKDKNRLILTIEDGYRHKDLIQAIIKIRRAMHLNPRTIDLIDDVIHKLFVTYQDLGSPVYASYNRPFGLLIYTLRCLKYCLEILSMRTYAPQIEDSNRLKEPYTVAVILAALFKELYQVKCYYQLFEYDNRQNTFHHKPVNIPFINPHEKRPIRIEKVETPIPYQKTSFFLGIILMPTELQQILSQETTILAEYTDFMMDGCDTEPSDQFKCIIHKVLAQASQKTLFQENNKSKVVTATKHYNNASKAFIHWIQNSIKTNAITCNENESFLYRLKEGWFIALPYAIHEYMKAHKNDAIAVESSLISDKLAQSFNGSFIQTIRSRKGLCKTGVILKETAINSDTITISSSYYLMNLQEEAKESNNEESLDTLKTVFINWLYKQLNDSNYIINDDESLVYFLDAGWFLITPHIIDDFNKSNGHQITVDELILSLKKDNLLKNSKVLSAVNTATKEKLEGMYMKSDALSEVAQQYPLDSCIQLNET